MHVENWRNRTSKRYRNSKRGVSNSTYGIQRFKLNVTVGDADVPTLLEREWLTYFKLDWQKLFPIQDVESVKVHTLEYLEKKLPTVFQDESSRKKVRSQE